MAKDILDLPKETQLKVRGWRNSVRQFMFEQSEISEVAHNMWLERLQIERDSGKPKQRVFLEEGLGVITFSDILGYPDLKSAVWGFYLLPEAEREDKSEQAGMRLMELGLKIGFEELTLILILGYVFEKNPVSKMMHLMLGFREFAELKSTVGKYNMLSLTRIEYMRRGYARHSEQVAEVRG